MAKYVVVFDAIGVSAENPKEDPPTYHSRGDEVELSEKEAKRLLDLGAVKAAEDAEDEDTTLPEPVAPSAPPNEPPPAEEEAGEKLTHKQSLVKEAGERGLDTSGTIPELEARIDEDKKAKGEE